MGGVWSIRHHPSDPLSLPPKPNILSQRPEKDSRTASVTVSFYAVKRTTTTTTTRPQDVCVSIFKSGQKLREDGPLHPPFTIYGCRGFREECPWRDADISVDVSRRVINIVF